MESNSLSYIGLAFRAGKTVVGTAACEKGVKRGKVRLLLLQQGMSCASKRRFSDLCNRCNVAVLIIDDEEKFGTAIGREGIMVLGITDLGFANVIRNNFTVGVTEYE